MPKQDIQNHYDAHWTQHIQREGDEQFERYERNWVLPPLFPAGKKVLDLACGSSIVGEYVQKKCHCSVTAFDISPIAIKEAKRRGVDGVVGSVEEPLPFKNISFDIVFWGDNIEHLFFPEKTLKEIYRILKPGGKVILSTPNQAYWRYRLHMLCSGSLPKTEGLDNPPWSWEHIRFFNQKILHSLLSKTGFNLNQVIGVSRRRLDKPFLSILPTLFGMILVVEAQKK